ERLEQFGDGWVFRVQPDRGARHTDFRQARANGVLAADKGGPSCGAALLAVEVRERDAFVGDAVDVRRPVAHHAAAEVTDVPRADVIAPENQNVRLLGCHLLVLALLSNRLTGFLEIVSTAQVRIRDYSDTRKTHRNPTCAMPVSIICGCLAAGR